MRNALVFPGILFVLVVAASGVWTMVADAATLTEPQGVGGGEGGVRGAAVDAARKRIGEAQDELLSEAALERLLTGSHRPRPPHNPHPPRRPSCRTTRRMPKKKTAVCVEDPVDVFRTCLSKATVGRQTNPFRFKTKVLNDDDDDDDADDDDDEKDSDRIRRHLQHKMNKDEDFTPFENNLLKRIKVHMDAKMRYQRCRGCKPVMERDEFELVTLDRAIPLFYGVEAQWDCPALLSLEEGILSFLSFFGDTTDFQIECVALTQQLSSPNGNPVNFPPAFAVAAEVSSKDKGVTAATAVLTYKVRKSFLLGGVLSESEDDDDDDDEEEKEKDRRRLQTCTSEDQILCCSQSVINGDEGIFCELIGCDPNACGSRRRRDRQLQREEGEEQQDSPANSPFLRRPSSDRSLLHKRKNAKGYYIHLPNGEWVLEMEDEGEVVDEDDDDDDDDDDDKNKIPFVNPDCDSSAPMDFTTFITCCNEEIFAGSLEDVELLVGEEPEIVRDVAICGYNSAVLRGLLTLPNGTDLVEESPSTLTCSEFEASSCGDVLDATDFGEPGEENKCFAGERPGAATEPSASPTEEPSARPSETPSALPSDAPSYTPSAFPSDAPSYSPSETPSSNPTCQANVVIDFETDVYGNPLSLGDVIDHSVKFVGGATVEASRAQEFRRKPRPFNAGMIFDATMITGNDADLNFPERRNILIITENFDSTDPDDNARGGLILVTFETPVRVEEMSFLDIDNSRRQTRVDFFGKYDHYNPIESVMIPRVPDGVGQMITFGVDGVKSFLVRMGGSGAIDDIFLRLDCDAP